ncbi:ABC transporter substrate-binding protein [Aureimonas sp. AU12]|uniref:ABC transporter substrate-binding protein n=1 Tax=Aureimonas sp. AU12 TaxID=1638161 RepID=UPI000A878E70|nr:extracellular solute-binding protein [Aureimonas sp. AU12]
MTYTRPHAWMAGVTLAATTFLASTAGFAQGRLEALEAAAKAEGALLIYSSNQEAEMDAKVAAFEAAYPEIDAQYIRLPSAQVFARFIGESDAGVAQADLLTTASTVIFQEKPDLFVEISLNNVPVLGEKTPLIAPENTHYAVYQTDVQLVTYNSDLVSEADVAEHLKSWKNLADPRWKNKIAIVDPRASTNQLSFFLGLRDVYGDAWFGELMANEPEIVGTASAAAQQLAAGGYEILVPSVPVHSAALRKQGAPLAMTLPSDLVHAPAQGTGVPKNARHPNAALLFVNWLLGEEGQKLQCSLGGISSMPMSAADCPNALPAEHRIGRDIIPTDEAKQLYQMIGLQP